MGEFARLEEQLSGVERYAMKFLEAENAEFAAQQLRVAEVHIHVHTVTACSTCTCTVYTYVY